jgi:hypothetical protein
MGCLFFVTIIYRSLDLVLLRALYFNFSVKIFLVETHLMDFIICLHCPLPFVKYFETACKFTIFISEEHCGRGCLSEVTAEKNENLTKVESSL